LQKLLDLVELKTIDDLPEEIVASQPAQDLKSLLETLRSSGTDNIIFDVTLMRGLDYYTGTVFEIFDNNQENNSEKRR
jgi:histidyl-tRNA synthetase